MLVGVDSLHSTFIHIPRLIEHIKNQGLKIYGIGRNVDVRNLFNFLGIVGIFHDQAKVYGVQRSRNKVTQIPHILFALP